TRSHRGAPVAETKCGWRLVLVVEAPALVRSQVTRTVLSSPPRRPVHTLTQPGEAHPGVLPSSLTVRVSWLLHSSGIMKLIIKYQKMN
ncbi:hypothetical protein SFRURICE_014965, partial [Spodoptera frugiperda]